jgi:hypothetical protein
VGCRGLKLTVEYCPGYGTQELRCFQPTGIGPGAAATRPLFHDSNFDNSRNPAERLPALTVLPQPWESLFFLIKHPFQFCLQTSPLCLETLGLVQTFRFSTGRQVPIITERSSGTQESISLFAQSGRLAGQEFIGRLPGSRPINSGPPTRLGSPTPVFTQLQCQQNTETVGFISDEEGRF